MASTRRGTLCQSPAMPNGRCRIHGGLNPGAPKGNRNAWKHGRRSREAIELRRLMRLLAKDCRDALS
ncbi:HGGxSTG domain-containing protein [Polymorphobacter fuscus]|uniref:HGGxSTG domain-containing protein n=1 Tax=Sandarakinorhabdus fusca TaxID=1439888 RepID=UPI003C727350